jgi:hypothetical protein
MIFRQLGFSTCTLFVESVLFTAAAIPLSLPASAVAESHVGYESRAEVYTERGTITGCGINFDMVWMADGMHLAGIIGSASFFFISEQKDVAAALKFAGIYGAKKQSVSYAWVQTSSYGKSTDFPGTAGAPEHPGEFVALKYSDSNTALLPLQMAEEGFTLSVLFDHQRMDNIVEVPPSRQSVIAKLQDCFVALGERMKSVIGP